MGGWSNAFLTAIKRNRQRPRYLLESWTPWPGGIGSSLALSSGRLVGKSTKEVIIDVSTTGSSVRLATWTSDIGGFSVRCIGARRGSWIDSAELGTFVRLLVGFEGWDHANFVMVAWGMIYDVRADDDATITIEVGGPLMALQSRATTLTASYGLFSAKNTTVVAGSAYSIGGGTIQVASRTGFGRDTTGTVDGLLKVTGDAGGQFYLRWTAVSTGDVFTVGTPQPALDTTDDDAAIGNAVAEIWFYEDHPMSAALATILSTGTALQNGIYDTLPAKWAFGIPEEYCDVADAEAIRDNYTLVSGSDNWQIFTDVPQANGIDWVQSWLSEGGYFLAMRQGLLTVRAWRDPELTDPVATITDDDIASWEFAARHPDYAEEYQTMSTTTPDDTEATSSQSATRTLPSTQTVTTSISHVRANDTAIMDGIQARLAPWYQAVPEWVRITCAGMRLATLANGDVVELTTQHLGRLRSTTPYSARKATVQSVDPQWSTWEVRVELAILPLSSD